MPANYLLFRDIAACLFLIDFVRQTPFFDLFYGRYQNGKLATSPGHRVALYIMWLGALMCIVFDYFLFFGVVALFAIFRTFHVNNRFDSIYRSGAPGLMSYWAIAMILLMELSLRLAPGGTLAADVSLLARVDFAVIMIGAGISKGLSGYLANEGINYVLVNPMWCRISSLLKKIPLKSKIWWGPNLMACTLEVAGGIMLLIPAVQTPGALLIMTGFLLLTPLVRLDCLTILMAAIPLLFLPELNVTLFSSSFPPATWAGFPGINTTLRGCIYGYLLVLPIIKLMQHTNYFADISWPQPLQKTLSALASSVPIVLWRVFTADVANYFLKISEHKPDGTSCMYLDGPACPASRFTWAFVPVSRYHHATELISLSCIINRLKYFPSNPEPAYEKLRRYARTLADNPESIVRFQYVSISTSEGQTTYRPLFNFDVDLQSNNVNISSLEANIAWGDDQPASSPVKECADVESYLAEAD